MLKTVPRSVGDTTISSVYLIEISTRVSTVLVQRYVASRLDPRTLSRLEREVTSAPCFEIWVLLHFEQTDAPFVACQNVIHRVQTHLPGYQKADPETVKQLLPQLEYAMTNAHWLSSRAGIADENPITSVHRVIAHLRAISASLK
jgi:hypothetical protein